VKLTYIVSGIKKAVFFENTAIELRNKGYDINFIIVGVNENSFYEFLKAHKFEVVDIKVKNWFSYPIYSYKIYKILKKFKPEVVHTHLVTANILGLIGAWIAGIKIRVFTRHSGKRRQGDYKTLIYDKLTKIFSTKVIAVSKIVEDLLLKEGYRKSNITVINYGFNLERIFKPDMKEVMDLARKYNPDNQHPVIGVIARAVELKGIQYTITAFRDIIKVYPNARLCLFNFSEADPYASSLNSLLKELPENSYIKVLFEKNIYDLYKIFDLFVHVPTNKYYEAFGQVYVESLAAGIPSVFTISGVSGDFIKDKENALVVNYNNSIEIEQAIISLLENENLREKISVNGIASAKKLFSLDTYSIQLDNFYHLITNSEIKE